MRGLFFYIAFIFSALITSVSGQTLQEQTGDEALRTGNYQTAWNFYGEALKGDSLNPRIWYKMGLAAKEMFNYTNAFIAFRTVWENDREQQWPDALFFMAELSCNLSDYVMAKAYYSLYIESKPTNVAFEERANLQLLKFSVIEELVADTSNQILTEHLTLPVNSPFSESGGVQLFDDRLYFTSVRPLLDEEGSGILGNTFLSAIYYSDFSQRGLTIPLPMEEPVNSRSEHTANLCFNEDGSEVWFNRCEITESGKFRCDLFTSVQNNGSWSKPRKLDINVEGYTSTQPCFVQDSSGNGVLYFASDRPGGFGLHDIWFSVRHQGVYQPPVNAGSIINTKLNEITPFYDVQDSTLWFASDGWFGTGGYDIFYSNGALSRWSVIENAGKPFNSAANDFAFNINTIDRDGYFTSNREGSYYFKGETCCNDLYAWYGEKDKKPDTLPEDRLPEQYALEHKLLEILPLDLYFHNDIPDPRSRDTVTDFAYDQTYYAYMAMVDRYRKEYAKGLSGADAEKAEAEIDLFFLAYVTAGFRDMLTLTPLLTEDLQNGSHVTLKIQGFCSPLTDTEYNIHLAKRRISSIINYFLRIDGGQLQPYLSGTAVNGGRLTILSEPVGEALSESWVSDNPNDVRNSVYSIAAARERRVQIVSYDSDFKGKSLRKTKGPLLLLSLNEVNISLEGSDEKCQSLVITNNGDETLTILSLESAQPWLKADLKDKTLLPGNVTTLNVCIDRTMLKNPALGVLVITSNSRDKRSVVYVRVGE